MSYLDYKQAELFKDLILMLGCMGSDSFTAMCESAWANRSEHMYNKFWVESKCDPWRFIISLDPVALQQLVRWYNSRVVQIE